MTDGPAGSRGDTLGLRLTLAFLAVALAAVGVLAGFAAAFTAKDVSSLASQQRTDLTSAIAVAAGAAWDKHNSWPSADLAPVLDLAERSGVYVGIRDPAGHLVASTPGFTSAVQAESSQPVIVQNERVGTVQARFTGSGLEGADSVLRDALFRAIAGAAGLAALLALLTGLAVARRITRPITRLIAVTRAMAAGDRGSRAGDVRAQGELRELAAAFDQMADTLDREDQIRRDLVAGVAHELRTPIAVLQAGHEALLDGVTEPTPAELSSLRDEVLRLARMVDDLQTMAAADAATLRLDRRPCDLAGIAATAADSLTRRFEAADVALSRRLASVQVLADPRWLHQVVTNLLANALKFTPAGGQVTIVTGAAGADAVLEVADTGVGIPAEELPRIFDRFFRGQGAAQTSGSGIGLAIAAELARAHGGDLTASSQPSQGTQLTLTLPQALPACSVLAGDDVGVDLIAVQVHGVDGGEARLGEHLPCRLLAPHGAQAHPAVGQGHGHAVHARHGVQVRPQRVVQVLGQLAGGGRVDAEVDTARAQCRRDPGEHQVRSGLVVHRVEGGDEVEPAGLAEAGGVAFLEARVGEALVFGLLAGGGDPGVGKVEAGDSRPRERLGHQVGGVTGPATDVGDVDALAEPAGQPRYQRQRHVDQGGVVHGSAVLGHDRLEPRVRRVRHPATGAETVHDLVFHHRHQPDVLHAGGKVVQAGRPGEPVGVTGGQRIRSRLAVVLDDPAGGHRRQPFPHVPLVERGPRRDLGARRGRHCRHDVEQSGAVAHAHHQGQRGLVHRAEHPLGEFRRALSPSLTHRGPLSWGSSGRMNVRW
jgi:two-component system, OmpR family, sensor histidine kinase BaeS